MVSRQGERISKPIADDLRPALSPERSAALWRRIAHARDAQAQRRSPRVMRSPAFALGIAALVMIGGVLVVRELRAPQPVARPSHAPLTRSDGRALEVIAPEAQAADVALSDGSRLWIAPGSVLVPLDVSDHSVVLHLVRGRSRFAVRPGGPRRWVVEAGLASVEVVGTRFSVEREPDAVVVRVEEGKVLVRGASLPDGVSRLTAGQTLRVPAAATTPAPSGHEGRVHEGRVIDAAQGPGTDPPVRREAALEPGAPSAPASPKAPGQASARGSARAAAVDPPPALDADALFVIADDARMTRDYRGALAALERVIQQYGGDPRAKLAAFTIGRIRDEHLHDLAGATAAYEQALSLGLSGSLAEDCYSRLLRVLDLQAARGLISRQRVVGTAQQYLQRYPKGRYAADARGVLRAESAP